MRETWETAFFSGVAPGFVILSLSKDLKAVHSFAASRGSSRKLAEGRGLPSLRNGDKWLPGRGAVYDACCLGYRAVWRSLINAGGKIPRTFLLQFPRISPILKQI